MILIYNDYRTITIYKLHMIIVTNDMKYFKKKKERQDIKKKKLQ